MQTSQSPTPPKKRVGIYERLGGSATTSPTWMFGAGITLLAVLIALIVVFSKYW